MRALTPLPRRLADRLLRLVPDRRDQALVIAVMTAVMLALAGTVAIVRSVPAGARSEQAFDVPALDVAPPTTATTEAPTTTTTTAPAAPAPQALPASAHTVNLGGDVHKIEPATRIGSIVIPKINLDHPVFEGVDETVIHWGPGHWPGSAMPGAVGNAVFAGHRVTHTRPFYDIDLLVPGDDIIVHTAAGTFTYQVTGHQIVTPKDTWIVNPTPTATITIFACHPKHSAAQRYVVRGNLVSSGAPS
ncbi:MAG TPA: class E sortase [Acidimicrobiia bacterium]|nr:class E sortase [Acidimicrobiia bacterium]